jgi:3-oxoacyl-[acyl-carrier protein] reductase
MDLDLRGKRAIVCGSSQGIGKASAIELASMGASIILIARNEEKLRIVQKQLDISRGQKHEYIVVDFSFPQELKKKVEEYVSSNIVEILVNNTGGPAAGLAIDSKSEDFVKAFSDHLLCNHILAQAVVPGMKTKKFGRIINVISTSVKIPIKGLGVSNTIRGAVANWSKTLANELGAFGITVNNVLPGSTMTGRLEEVISGKAGKTGKSVDEIRMEMIEEIPAKRIGEPHEIAAVIGFLASPAAAYVNGVNIPVDGGRTGSL